MGLARGRGDLRRLVVGNAVSTFGNAVYLIAVTLLLKELTQSALALGLFQFLALLPGFILSPLTGAVIDRVPRRTTVVLSDAYRAGLMIAFGLLLLIPGSRSPALILAVSLAAGVGHAFFVPAAQALMPTLVDPRELHTANGIRAGATQGANLVGNVVGGALFAALGAPVVMILNGITFGVSAVSERTIRASEVPGAPGRPVLQEAREGIREALGTPRLTLLLVSQAALFVVSPVLMLALPFIVIDELGLPEPALGLFFAAALAGGIAAFAALRRLPGDRLLERPLPVAGYGLLALLFATLALTRGPVVVVGAAFASGAGAALVYLYVITYIQRTRSPRMHGRLFALMEAGSSLVAPIAYLAAGAVLELLGPQDRWIAFAACGAGCALWAGVLSRSVARRAAKASG